MRAEKHEGLNIISARTFFFHSRYPIIRGHFKGWMPAAGRILKKMAKPDDVLFTVSEPNLLMTYFNGRLAKKLGLKHVFFTWQNVPYKERIPGIKLKLTEWLIRKNISLGSGAVCGNNKAFDILSQYAPAGFKMLSIPVSGIDTGQFKPGIESDFREKYGLKEKIVLTFIGALDKRKGIETLLNSFITVSSSDSRLRLVIIGAGPLEGFVNDFISAHEIENKVIRLPWLENDKLPGILCGSDIFLYPSEPYGGWEEQFGYSIAEASACGLPVISTDSGSIPEKVINNKTGFLIKPGSQEELIRAIFSLAADSELRRTMGQAGRQLIAENFSHEIVAQKLEKFLRDVAVEQNP